MKTQIGLEQSSHRQFSYLVTSLLVILSYGLFISGLTLVLGPYLFKESPLLIALTIFVLAIALNPIRSMLHGYIESRLFKVNPYSGREVQRFTNDLTTATSLTAITNMLREQINRTLNPAQLHIYFYDPISKTYKARMIGKERLGETSSELEFNESSDLVKVLNERKAPVRLGNGSSTLVSRKSDQSKIALLGTSLFVPIQTRSKLEGWVALQNHSKGIPYNQKQIDFLEELSNQTAMAVERVKVLSDLDRRITEMNVLTRVSQGVNITLALNDMLELIFSQLSQILQFNVFQVILRDPENDSLSCVFYVDDDERLLEKENKSIGENFGLDGEVIRGRRPIVTDDYDEECRRHGVIPSIREIYAWTGIPLNTGAETIGLISIGNRDPSMTYSTEQINLLQSIADQTAGAMIKVNLLQEAERRTNQLRFLNESIRKLSQTLEPEVLLKRVLDGAVELVNCKFGTIWLIDSEVNDLILKEKSLNLHEHPTDIYGSTIDEFRWRAVNTAEPVIVSEKFSNDNRSGTNGEAHGQSVKNILIVPIQLKDQIIGIIELYDRMDGLAFTKDDQELLHAFSRQAAIAYENAQKYTFTDRSLSARLEELSVMQRIDRELNAGLDVTRAMQITLDWAIRQSEAESGIVGIVEADQIRIMAAQGYEETMHFEQVQIEVTPTLKQVIDSGQPLIRLFSEKGEITTEPGLRLMEGAQAQYVIPMQREAEVIGIILLESSSLRSLPEEKLDFILRLSDHAAIAIANAQLFLEVKAANLAKSEFVSFVSHELKTPMTSIKGFADLLAAGAVGPINDVQNNFLSTIRSNVDRMATLVSDLSDVSRIEANRMRLDFESVPVKGIIEEVVRSSHNQLEVKNQTLQVDIVDQLPLMWGDRIRLIQILTNLVSNAIKYSPPNSEILVSAEQSENSWDLDGPARVIHISVRDSGFGISPQDQMKIFEKFFRADDPNIREVSGTGLGLNITKTLVEMQGGKIWFDSRLNEGSTFHFTTPISEIL